MFYFIIVLDFCIFSHHCGMIALLPSFLSYGAVVRLLDRQSEDPGLIPGSKQAFLACLADLLELLA